MHRSGTEFHAQLVIASIILLSLLIWIVLQLATVIGNALGQIGVNIINHLFAPILAAIVMKIMANALKQLFPVLTG